MKTQNQQTSDHLVSGNDESIEDIVARARRMQSDAVNDGLVALGRKICAFARQCRGTLGSRAIRHPQFVPGSPAASVFGLAVRQDNQAVDAPADPSHRHAA